MMNSMFNLKLPFPGWTLNTVAKIFVMDIDEDGKETTTVIFDGKVQYVEKTKQIINPERQLVTISGWIVIPGAIERTSDDFLTVEVGGQTRRVSHSNVPYNPDGSVFSTELYLI